MSFVTDLKNVHHLTIKSVHGTDHAERMENFYADQVEIYDDFRERFLQGKKELLPQLPVPDGGVWVDMGAGTGWRLEHCHTPVSEFSKVCCHALNRSSCRTVETGAADDAAAPVVIDYR